VAEEAVNAIVNSAADRAVRDGTIVEIAEIYEKVQEASMKALRQKWAIRLQP
jgi:hypothetical protein